MKESTVDTSGQRGLVHRLEALPQTTPVLVILSRLPLLSKSMPAPSKPTPSTQSPAVTLTFSATELLQLEAVASLHGESLSDFIQRAALESAKVSSSTVTKRNMGSADDLWLTESFADARESEATPELFAPVADQLEPDAAEPTASVAKRGVVGEQSKLAKGQGLVWEIRRALGRERLHGLGCTDWAGRGNTWRLS